MHDVSTRQKFDTNHEADKNIIKHDAQIGKNYKKNNKKYLFKKKTILIIKLYLIHKMP